MCKLISILIINESHLQEDALDPGIKYLIADLTDLNYTVKKVSAIESDPKSIMFEVEHSLKQNDFVILIDKWNLKVTFSSVCHVFNTELVLAHSVQDRKTNLGDIMVPKISKLLEYDNSFKLTPVLYMGRLFIVRERNLKLVYDKILKSYLEKFNREKAFVRKLWFQEFDVDLNDYRNKSKYVNVYSESDGDSFILVMKSSDLEKLLEYQRRIMEKCCKCLQKGSGYYLENIYERNSFPHIQRAIECVESCLRAYGPENVFLSFNGGKDCTVLLHIVLCVLRERYPDYRGRLVCMHIQSLNPFAAVTNFIELARQYYDLEMVTITKGVKEGLETFLLERPYMKACLMGTRRTDPHSQNLHECQLTDPSWPQVMRVSPLLDWYYSEIWDYLLYYQVPYCTLYDLGYTSLGSVNNTVKNPDLLYTASMENEMYLPAYKLLDGNKERNGRV